jgi:hypothetical protein
MISCDQALCLEFLKRDLGSLWKDEDVPTLISHDETAKEACKIYL